MTEATEFWKIYKLDVDRGADEQPLKRLNHADVIFRTEREKYKAIAEEIETLNKYDVVELKEHDGSGRRDHERRRRRHRDPPQGRNKQKAAAEHIARDRISHVQKRGRPILVGTVSIEKSERLSAMLERRGIKHQVLNAKHHKREAEIVAQAGRKNAVTIATNMAGRGTDIILGGNPETMAWAQLQNKYATRLDVPSRNGST